MVLFAGMAVGFALGIVVAALLSAPAADPGCDHCVLAEERTNRVAPSVRGNRVPVSNPS